MIILFKIAIGYLTFGALVTLMYIYGWYEAAKYKHGDKDACSYIDWVDKELSIDVHPLLDRGDDPSMKDCLDVMLTWPLQLLSGIIIFFIYKSKKSS